MWLLSTDRAELRLFSGPEDPNIIGGYAILSHTWGDSEDEQSFRKTQDLHERCKETGENPRDLAAPKVRESCILAERHGYRWIWNDTCCIDQTNSVELSEAIKSMFRWYSLAEVCFAYLADVQSDCDLDAPDSAFRMARWHSRGWTLQELIAPSFVVFVSCDWEIIGCKTELAQLLEEITGVWSKVLTREVHHSKLCIASRMMWASGRSTKRVEDEAYCLMGLFDIHMPTIYGEGRHAFQRLQYELMKESSDTSLFAWGRWISFDNATPVERHRNRQFFNTPSEQAMYILARSPKNFAIKPFGRAVRYIPSAKNPLQRYPSEGICTGGSEESMLGPFGPIKLPRFSSASCGLECHFPIIESDELEFAVAVLLCETGREHLGLLLHPADDRVQDPSRKKYYTGYGFRRQPRDAPYPHFEFARFVSLGDDLYNLRLNGKVVTAKWRDIFIADRPPPPRRDILPNFCSSLHSITPAPPFRIPHWLISRLSSLGMEPRSFLMGREPVDEKSLHMSATFEDATLKEGIRLILGTCIRLPLRDSPAHWAKAVSRSRSNWSQKPDFSHVCAEDHVDVGRGWMKDFGDAERTIRLSFSRCTLTPACTLVVHVELRGHRYEALKDERGITFPSRDDAHRVRVHA